MTAAQWRNDRNGWGQQSTDGYVPDGHKALCPRGCGAKVTFYGGQPSRHLDPRKKKKANCV